MSHDIPATKTDDEVLDSVWKARFEATRNALYHTARRLFLERCNRLMSFLIIVFGAAALNDMLPGAWLPLVKSISGIVVLLAGTLQLVFDFGGMARTHEFLGRRYYEILARIEETIDPTAEFAAKLHADMFRIYADEPPQMRALDAIVYNQASRALGATKILKFEWYHLLTRHIISWANGDFPQIPAKLDPAEDAA